MSTFEMQSLLEAGMHFGHLTRRWNPKMKPFIYGVRNGIHIIDLSKTARQLNEALRFITDAVAEGRDVLFVGTKKQAQDIIREESERCKMYYINQRWLGGTLTNWRTIKSSIDRLKTLQKKKNDGTFAVLSKKEILMIDREIDKLLHSLGGIQDLNRPPGVMVIIDPKLEKIALHEANVLGIPVIALADTNCDPDPIDYLVAGNDDALRSIQLFLSLVADQILEGLQLREANARKADEVRKEKDGDKPAVREVKVSGEKAGTYVGDLKAEGATEEAKAGTYSAKAETPEPDKAPEEGAEEEKPAEEAQAPEAQETSKTPEAVVSSESPVTGEGVEKKEEAE